MDIDINQLRLLVLLDHERNLSRAAQRLFMSQSAASHILSKLRNRFDDPLFIKTKMGMEPTPFTTNLLPDIKKGLSSIELALDKAKPFAPSQDAKTFYIGAIDYFEFYGLPKLAAIIEKSAPNIRIGIDILSENMQFDRVENGNIDLLIAVDDLQTVPRYYHRYHWLSDDYVGIVASTNKLPSRLTLQQFLQTSQVHLPMINSAADPIDRWLLSQHQYRQISVIVQSYAVGGMVTAKSNYFMCVPRNIARGLIEMLPLKVVELPEGVPPLSLSMFTHQLYDSQDSVQWLIKQLKACV